MRFPRWSALATIGGAGALVAHLSHRQADNIRTTVDLEQRVRFLPNPQTVRVAAMGYQMVVADLAWMRAVLTFADMVDGRQQGGQAWLLAMLHMVVELDPTWRTPYFYGGGMLRLLGDIDASDDIYRRGMDHLPGDPFFPFSIAMNAWLYRDDHERAFHYLDLAAAMPRAPSWYRAAAAAFLDERGQRRAAIRYLSEQMKADDRPEVVAAVMPKYRSLVHDDLAEQIEQRREEWERHSGHRLTDLSVLGELPEDPYGEGWILAPDSRIRSRARDRGVARDAQALERRMLLAGDAPPGDKVGSDGAGGEGAAP